ncbi:MAG: carbohydrate porin [Verrucomicrobiota bacterium]
MKRIALAILALGTAVLPAAEEDLAAELRKELDAIRNDYEVRIEKLEQRIEELEKDADQPPPARESVPPHEHPPAPRPEAERYVEPARETTTDEQPTSEMRRRRDEALESFRSDTESRDYRRSDAERLLDDRIDEILEGYLDITGYFRSGYGRSDAGGPQRAFGLPGVAKYRLGNEAENYGELAFSKTFFSRDAFRGEGQIDGPVAQMNLRLSIFNPYDNFGSGADTEFAAPEIWASVGNVIPGMPEAKFWAGSRFYRRHDIHINDYYFWDMSGGGAGIEDVPFSAGKLALAWIGDGAESAIYDQIGTPDPLNAAGFSKTNIDLRYYDWPLFGGEGELGLTYSRADSGVDSNGVKAENTDGVALSLVRTHTGFLDENSVHKTSLQIGTGPAKTFTSGFDTFSDPTGTYIRPDPNESWRVRATDHWVVKPHECISFGTALVYQYTDFGSNAPEQHWLSGGVRPIWHLNDWASIAFEGGYDWISNSPNGSHGSLAKFTIAPQVSLGDEFFSRPVIRGFVTYAVWNDGMRGVVGGTDYATETSGWSWGVQMESWW